jgi:hypothetical protein
VCLMVFGNCESGSGALLGAQDNSVSSPAALCGLGEAVGCP